MNEAVARKCNARIQSRRHPRLGGVDIDVDLGQGIAAKPRAPALIREAFSLKMKRELDPIELELSHELGERLSDITLIRKRHHDDVLGAAATVQLVKDVAFERARLSFVSQHVLEGFRVGELLALVAVHPSGYQSRRPITSGGVVGIVVGEDRHAARASARGELHRGVARAPKIRAPRFRVRRDRRHTGTLRDRNGLFDRIEKCRLAGHLVAREIPHGVGAGSALVLHENTVIRRQCFDHGDDFLRIAPASGDVFEACAHPVSAGLHTFDDETSHGRDLGWRREALHTADLFVRKGLIRILGHRHRAHGVVSNYEHGIRAQLFVFELAFPEPRSKGESGHLG